MFTFVGASRGHLCDSTAFLYVYVFMCENKDDDNVHSSDYRLILQ